MQEVHKNSCYINVFENITELSNYITKRKRKPGRSNDSENTGDFHFYGTNSFEESIELLKYGDEELYKKVLEEKNNIKIDKMLGNSRKRQTYENNVYGCVPNVPAYLKGNPVNMINNVKNVPSHKIINIFLNIRVSAFVDIEDVIKIGTKYLSIIDLLEKNGYRCNLYSGVANSGHSEYSYMLVKVKTDKEPLNLKKICFTIANASMQRRIKFKWMEVNDSREDMTNHGYGRPDNESHTKDVLKQHLKEEFIIWTYERDNNSKTVEEIINNLKNYGINLEV